MAEPAWFETDSELDEIQRAFVAVMRTRATAWPMDPVDTFLDLGYDAHGKPLPPGEQSRGRCLVGAHIRDADRHVGLLTFGAYLDADHVIGDKVHNQLFTLPAAPTALAFRATGSPEEVGHRTADWFEALLRRPIAYQEWLRSNDVFAQRWIFADTGQPLVEGRIRTGELGPPDRVVAVRTEPRT